MFRFIVAAIATLAFASAQGATPAWGDQHNGTYRNPVVNADFSDPDIIRVGDRNYMVASDFHFMGMQILESADMVNWRYVTHIYPGLGGEEYTSMNRYGGGSWAPAIRHHDGRFYVYFCTPDEGLFMTSAPDAAGPWEPLTLVKKVPKWEDPCPFWDDDGNAYLGHSLYGAGPIIIHRMSPDGKRLLDDGVEVYRGPVAEGTKFHKLNGKYYMSIPEGGVRSGWQTVLRADNIYGPYERRVVLERGTTGINGPHQGAMVDTPDGRWWFYHFQETDALGRVLHLQPMTWSADGWPVIGVDYDGNGVGEPVEVWTSPLPSAAAEYSLATSDDFGSPILGPQWQWNHNPVSEAWSLDEQFGSLSLTALKSPSFKQARNTLTQKSVGWQSTFTTALETTAMADGQRAGLACMGKQNNTIGVMMRDGVKYIYTATDSTETILAELPDTYRPVYLRLNLDFPAKEFGVQYSLNGKDFTDAGTFYSRWGNWKGVRPALYSYNTLRDGGIARFQMVDYTHDGNNRPRVECRGMSSDESRATSDEEEIVAGIALTQFPDRVIDVYPQGGQAASLRIDARTAIQQAIDSCSLAGGGHVRVHAGEYFLPGNLVLKSNVDLHLDEGANLTFSGVADDFLPPVFTRWEGTELYGHSPMIYALNAVNIAITGRGTIDGQAGVEMAAWAPQEAPDVNRLRSQGEELAPLSERVYGAGTILRPACIEFVGCSRILLEDITVKNSPFWTIHPVYCDNVVVRGVTIDSHFANNDGCDPESTSNVLIEHCRFDVGDDAIAIKAGRDADGRRVGRPSQRIVIRHCMFNSQCNGLCIGSEMSGGVSDVHMHDIQIGTVKNALYFKSNRDRGGYIRNVYVSDITVQHTLGAVLRFETNYFGFRGGRHASQYEHFRINNVEAVESDNYALFISGYPEKPVRDVVVENLRVGRAPKSCYTHCTDSLSLINVSIAGTPLPEHPVDDPEERTLDVY